MHDKVLAAISLCRKAGRLAAGTEAVKERVMGSKAALVLLASDLSERTLRQMRFLCEQNQTGVCALPYTMEQLIAVTGKKCGVLAVCDKNFAEMIRTQIAALE